MVASSVPSPVVKVRPEVPDRDTVPSPTDTVTLSWPPGVSATSTSEVEIWFELAPEKVRLVSSAVVWAPGTEFTGGGFTAVTGGGPGAGAGVGPPPPGWARWAGGGGGGAAPLWLRGGGWPRPV